MINDSGFHRSTSHGVTLVELMLVVLVAAVLAGIAIPSYQRYVYRVHRVDAQEMLLRIRHAEERYYATYHKYSYDLGGSLGFVGDKTPRGRYRFDIAPSPMAGIDQGFVVSATPLDSQTKDACGRLSIDHRNTRLPARDDAAKRGNGPCW
jgi:type IV pilus assembly protein PilE